MKSDMKAITTKYYGPTATRSSRIQATDGDNTVWVSYYASTDPHRQAAIELCKKLEWTGRLVQGWTKTGSVFVFITDDVIEVGGPE